MSRIWPVLVVVTMLASASGKAAETVRIAVGRFDKRVEVRATAPKIVGDDGKALASSSRVRIRPGSDGLVIDGKRTPHRTISVSSNELRLRGHTYRGVIEISQHEMRSGKVALLVVHPIELERYVTGIVASELWRRWPAEAMKAQAVAARTYALFQKYRRLDLPYHMESSVLDQVYGGAERVHDDARQAVSQTRGEVLTFEREPIKAYFHSTCGGHTESAADGWGTPLDYLPGSACADCTAAKRYKWRAEIPQSDVDKAMHKFIGEPVRRIRVLKRTKTSRVQRVSVEGAKRRKTMSGGDLRRLLGYSRVWSTMITRLERHGARFIVEGKGAGHGVGMCQWGAQGMANKGADYRSILHRYYPGAALTRMY